MPLFPLARLRTAIVEDKLTENLHPSERNMSRPISAVEFTNYGLVTRPQELALHGGVNNMTNELGASNRCLESELAHCHSAASRAHQHQLNEIENLQKKLASMQSRHEFEYAVLRASLEKMLHEKQHRHALVCSREFEEGTESALCPSVPSQRPEYDKVPMDLDDYEMVDVFRQETPFTDVTSRVAPHAAIHKPSLGIHRRELARCRGARARNDTFRATRREIRLQRQNNPDKKRAATSDMLTSAGVGKRTALRYTGRSSKRRRVYCYITNLPIYRHFFGQTLLSANLIRQ